MVALLAGIVTIAQPCGCSSGENGISSDSSDNATQQENDLSGGGGDVVMKRVFIYMITRPTSEQQAELESLGVVLYPESWIPPVGDHPSGYFLAEVPGDMLDRVVAEEFILKLEDADRPLEPQFEQ